MSTRPCAACTIAGNAATADLGDELLKCRMSIIGLDFGAVERDYAATIDKLKHNCLACRQRAPCTVDLRRDPTNQVWEAYCPNSEALNALVALTEAIN